MLDTYVEFWTCHLPQSAETVINDHDDCAVVGEHSAIVVPPCTVEVASTKDSSGLESGSRPGSKEQVLGLGSGSGLRSGSKKEVLGWWTDRRWL